MKQHAKLKIINALRPGALCRLSP